MSRLEELPALQRLPRARRDAARLQLEGLAGSANILERAAFRPGTALHKMPRLWRVALPVCVIALAIALFATFQSPTHPNAVEKTPRVFLIAQSAHEGTPPPDAGVSPDGSGWALTQGGLQLTSTGGSSFTIVHPPVLPLSLIDDVAVDGSLVVVAGVTQGLDVVVDVSRDFGTSWTVAHPPTPHGQPGSVELVSDSSGVVGMVVVDTTGSAFSAGEWYTTADGGLNWTWHAAPTGGTVTVAGRDLWLVGGPISTELYRSSDLGTTWTRVSVPESMSRQDAALTVPGALDNGQVVLVATVPTPNNATTTHVAIFTSNDDGATWSALATASSTGIVGVGVVTTTSVASNTVWLGDFSEPRVTLVSSNGSEESGSATGPYGGVSSLSATGSQSAWAVLQSSQCVSGKSSCSHVGALYETSDGGASWQPVPLEHL
jgi:hypothetical protein